MIKTFHKHRDQFAQLQTKLCALRHSQIVKMNPEWSDPPVQTQVKESYYQLLHNVGAKGFSVAFRPRCAIDIDVWSSGFAGTPAEYKGYYYGQGGGASTTVVASLDHLTLTGSNPAFFQRPLEAGWWLEFDDYP